MNKSKIRIFYGNYYTLNELPTSQSLESLVWAAIKLNYTDYYVKYI